MRIVIIAPNFTNFKRENQKNCTAVYKISARANDTGRRPRERSEDMDRNAMRRRTDLICEAKELLEQSPGRAGALEGVKSDVRESEGCRVTVVEVGPGKGSAELCKPPGSYVTVDMAPLSRREKDAFGRGARAVAGELKRLLPLRAGDTVLVACLGNAAVTPDAVGPQTARSVLATRHLKAAMPEDFRAFRSVSVIETGVLGATGIESAELLKAAARTTRPDAVVAVDALASRRMERLCATIQLADSGIVPGSGVGNGRAEISARTLGVPVIAVGIPTVVDAATLAADLFENAGVTGDAGYEPGQLVVTPKDIDALVRGMSRLLACAINIALHPGLTVEDEAGLAD